MLAPRRWWRDGRRSRVRLRSAMRGAVAKTYEASRAAARVSAVDAGEYVLRRVKGGSVVDGDGVVLGTADDHYPQTRSEEGGAGVAAVDDCVYLGRTLYNVSYTKGMDGRGTYEERVEIIGLSVLKSVLNSVYNTDPLSYDADTRWLQRECGRQAPSCTDSPVVAPRLLVVGLSLQRRLNREPTAGDRAVIRGEYAPIDVAGIELVAP